MNNKFKSINDNKNLCDSTRDRINLRTNIKTYNYYLEHINSLKYLNKISHDQWNYQGCIR